jgi:hypothetical protein
VADLFVLDSGLDRLGFCGLKGPVLFLELSRT